ncbi:MAG: Na+/H+ antiporter NhaC family protein [Thermotaleaceae bacterium]
MSDFGWISLLPPIIAIVLALRTKQTLLSLFIAVWAGATIVNGYNPLIGFARIVSDYMVPSIGNTYNAGLLVLVTLAGGFVHMLRITGAAEAFAKVVTKSIDNGKKGQIITWASAFIFSYTEPCLILGTIMRPVTDKVRISRAKLAYILDSMGCNLAAFSPISSYGPFIAGLIATQLAAASIAGNEWSIYIQMFPFNLYGIFAMATVLIVAVAGLDIGPMYREEKRARETGKLLPDGASPLVPEVKVKFPEAYNLTIKNFVIPMVTLFVCIFTTIFWSGDIGANGIRGAFIKGNITLAISMGFMSGSIAAGAVGVSTGLFKFTEGVNGFVTGMAELIMVPFILVMAWSMGGITGAMGVGAFLSGVVQDYLVGGLVPGLIFLFGALISFATGSSWGVWAIMMPIAVPMAVSFDIPIPFIIGAVIGGGLFGDQCSPISDTTIMSSTGAACDHIVHVSTQLVYGIAVGSASFLGFLFGGLTGQYYLSIAVTAVVLVIILFFMSTISKSNNKEIKAEA